MSYKDKKHLFDTNAFLEIKRVYPEEFFQDLHEILKGFIKNGTVLVHQKVYNEIIVGKADDPARSLLEEHKNKVLQEIQEEYDIIQKNNKKLKDIIDTGRKREQADPYLVARILFERKKKELFPATYCLVTMEKKGLPTVCKDFEITCMNVLEFFRNTDIKFTTQHGD